MKWLLVAGYASDGRMQAGRASQEFGSSTFVGRQNKMPTVIWRRFSLNLGNDRLHFDS
jgi:hypothetical protein